jgi:exodeoxyribonuclease V alpha subunit
VGNVNFLAKKSAFVEDIPKELILRAMYTDKRFVIEKDAEEKIRYTYIDMYNAEKKIFSEMRRLQNSSKTNDFTRRMFSEVQEEIGIEYSEQQKEAFGSLRSSGVKIITGSPGTGKTTVVNGIIKAFEKINPCGTVSLCAPTGRAAQQMREATGRPASTIHRLIDLRPFEGSVAEEHKITPINSDLIIVDEMSMVDTVLFSLLLSAIKNGALVILCGDSDQLPSVGAGNVLHDIIESNICETYRLSKIYRQKGTSNIVLNAHRIRENNTEMLEDEDFRIINALSEDEMIAIVSALSEEYYDKTNPYKFQILSAVKKGTIGVYNLNKVLQDICNPDECEELISCKFRVNDKVMFTVNNYKAGYVNGDIGTVVSTEDDTIVVKVDETEIAVPHSKVSDLMLAYSITTHKSQGSEFETVVVILPEQPKIMLQKKLIYTAITRAKKNVIIIAQNDSLQHSIFTDEFSKRRTNLGDRLTGKISLVER